MWQYVLFTIDHIISLKAGGTDTLDNMALACFPCNRKKADRLHAIDPVSQLVTPLFNPRQDAWEQHFIWSSDKCRIIGLTPIGRAMVEGLELNRPRIVQIRAADVIINRHPPKNDPVQNEPDTLMNEC